MTLSVFISAAFLLDLAIGDPVYRLHPVRLIGLSVSALEKPFRTISQSQLLNGALLAVAIPGIAAGTVLLLCAGAAYLDHFLPFPVVTGVCTVYLLYSTLSIRDLRLQSTAVCDALQARDIPTARRKLAMIVGRETEEMDAHEITRAAVETVAENYVDGVVAPLCFGAAGGAPAAVAYKAVNTLDSMVGYKNEAYLYFGRVSAQVDDICNYIPARFSVLCIAIAALICSVGSGTRFSASRALRITIRDGGKNPSPNSGLPEAAMAGALGIQLGGWNRYHGSWVEKPLVGARLHDLLPEDIVRINRLMYVASVVALVCVLTIRLVAVVAYVAAVK